MSVGRSVIAEVWFRDRAEEKAVRVAMGVLADEIAAVVDGWALEFGDIVVGAPTVRIR